MFEMPYQDYIDNMCELIEEGENLFGIENTHENPRFRSWRHRVTSLINLMTDEGYRIQCGIIYRSFAISTPQYGSIGHTNLEIYNLELRDTINELETIIDNYERFGEPNRPESQTNVSLDTNHINQEPTQSASNTSQEILTKAKSHPIVTILVFIGIAIGGIVTTTGSITDIIDWTINISGVKEVPKLIQFAVVPGTGNEESVFGDESIISYSTNYPVFHISIENPNDKDIVVTDIKYHVSKIGLVVGGNYGILKSKHQYVYILEHRSGIQEQQLIPPFKIPPKSIGAFELALTTNEGSGRVWIMEMELVTSTGSVKTDEFKLILSGE